MDLAGARGARRREGVAGGSGRAAAGAAAAPRGLAHLCDDPANVSLDDARNILEKFNSAYDMIPLGGGNKPTKFHAIVTGLKKSYEDILSQAVPELKDINRQYSLIRRVYNKYAPKLIDKDTGQFKQGAETYLSNLLNMNKGAEQKNIRALEELTGIPILDNIQALKDAQKLSNLFPATGSRTQDILRSEEHTSELQSH